MGWSLHILALSAAFIVIEGQLSAPENLQPLPPVREVVGDFLSYLGIGPCAEANCGGYETSEITETKTREPAVEDDYEPQYPDPYPTDKDAPKSGPHECRGLQIAIKDFERKHPDLVDVKCDVLKELIRITSFYMEKSEKCHPAVKLLDLIILAADKLKNIYTKGDQSNCEYLEVPVKEETTEVPVYTSTKYGRTKASSYHEVITPKPTPEYSTPIHEQTTKVYEKSYPDKHSEDHTPTEEIIAEEHDHIYPPFIGSIRGIPGKHYPNYTDVPITSFSCADKKKIPGFYADLETGCQVFHVCYEHRRESFLCPLGTIFNQPILSCDYWYSSNCSLAPVYYEDNIEETAEPKEMETVVNELITTIKDSKQKISKQHDSILPERALDGLLNFLPVKAKVTVFSETEVSETNIPSEQVQDVSDISSEIFDDIISTATRVISKSRAVVGKIPEPVEWEETKKPDLVPKLIKSKVLPAMKMKAVPLVAKAKVAGKIATMKAAIPIAAKAKLVAAVPVAKVIASKAAVPLVAKAKVAGKIATMKAAIPIAAKAKLVAAVPVAKVIASKAAVPVIIKAKVIAAKAAVPVVKVMAAKAAMPILVKTKIAAAVPIAKAVAAKSFVPVLAKAKVAAVPVAKVVAAKAAMPVVVKAKVAAAIPLTKSKVVAAKVIASKTALPAAKIALSKAAIPIVAKAKLAVAVPAKVVAKKVPIIVKGKIAAAVPIAKAAAIKASVPALKTKILAASIPFAKSAVLKSTIPIAKAKIFAPAIKAKIFKTAAIPVVKGKLLVLPLAKSKFAAPVLVKAKLAKAAVISPLTKKALALGYMKLLKAKKLALMG